MKNFLILMIVFVSNLLLLSACSSEGTIEILKDGEKLIGSSSNAGKGYINVTCDIND